MDTMNALLDAQEELRLIEKRYKLAKSVERLALKLEREYGNLLDLRTRDNVKFCDLERCTEVTPKFTNYCPRHDRDY